jgi:hypothetical protein
MKQLTIKYLTLALAISVIGWLVARYAESNPARARMITVAATPELPRVMLNTDYLSPKGRTIAVNEGGDFQAALNRALPGDVITLKAGATFTGNFWLPAKKGADWIVIRSSATDDELPPPGTRVLPQHSKLLAKIVTPNPDGAISTAAGSHHYRLIGLEIAVRDGVQTNYGIVRLGDGSNEQKLLDKVPTDFVVDRCYIHGNEKGNVSRGIALNSARTAVIDSYISECHGIGIDTQAICGWNGPGPFKIVNNYLEGAGENFMLGGADPSINGLIPSDVEFRRNHLFKPLRWKVDEPEYAGIHWTIKNLLELKNAQRVLIEANVLENNWADAQQGYAVLLKSVNQDGGAPWSVTRDVTFINNIVRHSGAAINILGRVPNQLGDAMKRVTIRNNLWDDIDGQRWGKTNGWFLLISDALDVVFDSNTVLHTGSMVTTYDAPSLNFVFTNNLLAHNEYGVKGDGTGVGNSTLSRYMPGAVFAGNVIAGGSNANYPPKNYFPKTLAEVCLIDRSGGGFRLTMHKAYKGAGLDGKDPGCDLAEVMKSTSEVIK